MHQEKLQGPSVTADGHAAQQEHCVAAQREITGRRADSVHPKSNACGTSLVAAKQARKGRQQSSNAGALLAPRPLEAIDLSSSPAPALATQAAAGDQRQFADSDAKACCTSEAGAKTHARTQSIASVLMARKMPPKLQTKYEAAMAPVHVQQHSSTACALLVGAYSGNQSRKCSTQHPPHVQQRQRSASACGMHFQPLLSTEQHHVAGQQHLEEYALSSSAPSNANRAAQEADGVVSGSADESEGAGMASQLICRAAQLLAQSGRVAGSGAAEAAARLHAHAARLQAHTRHNPAAQLVDKYAPQRADEVCGNLRQAAEIRDWLLQSGAAHNGGSR